MSDIKYLHSSKFTYANTLGYKRDRIFDPYTYRHFHDEDELEQLLNKYISFGCKIEDKAIAIMNEAPENVYLSRFTDSIDFGSKRVEALKTLIQITEKNMLNYFKAEEVVEEPAIYQKLSTLNTLISEESESTNYSDKSPISRNSSILDAEHEIEEKVSKIAENHSRVDAQILKDFIYGNTKICVPAVTIAFTAVDKVLQQLELELIILENKQDRDQYKIVFGLVLKLASIFDYFYAAMIADEEAPFYHQDEWNHLEEYLDFENVEDAKNYWLWADKGFEEVGRMLGVASKWCKYDSKSLQLLSLAGWMPAYFLLYKKKGSNEGLYFMNTLDKNVFHKLNQWPQSSLVKTIAKLSLPKVTLEKKIYIKISSKDELFYKKNLDSKKKPKWVKKDLDLPFQVGVKHYDETEFIKIRLISKDDWGTVNWKKGELIDPDWEWVTLPVALIYIHGGGFIGGSSGSYQPILRKYAIETGYPVFAIDYRLSPKYKFPTHLSDSWLSYLWIRYYSEKYLKVKFDKIILIGDSAGGCLSFSTSLLAIQKKWIKPDGMVLCYPGFCGDRTSFTPSLLLSIDEPYLNSIFIDHCLTSYVYDEKETLHYLCSPSYAPEEMYQQLPPTRMGIAGIDPLRDGSIQVFHKCVESGVDVKGKLYKYLFHGYLEMDAYPFFLEDTKKAFSDTIDYIHELVE